MRRRSTGSAREKLSGEALCAVCALMAALLSLLPFLIRDRGFFTLAYDYNYQQIPFAAAAHEGIRNLFSGEWIWNLDLGSSLITGFGFYNLGSPFFWITLLFPKASFPYLVGGLYGLKYMTAAVLACAWLKQFVRDRRIAALGGLLYAFSGFQSTNLLFYHFHDIVAFFPLLLCGMDRMMRGGRSRQFTFAVFLNSLVNYTFFVQEAIFLVLYFLFRYFRKDQIAKCCRQALGIFLAALAGVAMSAFLFLPNVLYVLSSARGKGRLDLGRLADSPRGILFILKGFLFPGEAMTGQSSLYPYQYASTSLYIPFFGMGFVLLYLIRNRGWLRNLLILLLLISFSPLIQSGFLLFTEPNQRWWYMLNLLCVLATVLALEKEQHRTAGARKLMAGYAAGVAAYCLLLWFARASAGERLIFSRELFMLFGGLAVLSAAACAGMVCLKRLEGKTALALVLIACVATTGATVWAYRRGDDHEAVRRDYRVGLQLEPIQDQYRYRSSENLYLLPGRGAGVGAFSSTLENSSYAFLSKVYDFHANFTYEAIALPGLPELMGGKYEILPTAEESAGTARVEADGVLYGITERPACPIGFATENYILLEELKKYDVDDRSWVLMDAVPVESPDAVAGFQERRYSEENRPEDPLSLIRRTEENRVKQFSRDAAGFRCVTDYSADRLVFFAVPFDAGWTACLDREETEVINACGMMALRVPAGLHEIAFSYRTPGTRPGAAISLGGWLLFCGTAFRGRKKPRAAAEGIFH
ncbi:MAG: YfhO family protein [Clostridia bacterium]|nr:YfhO family protein [Clostridia bacterium]